MRRSRHLIHEAYNKGHRQPHRELSERGPGYAVHAPGLPDRAADASIITRRRSKPPNWLNRPASRCSIFSHVIPPLGSGPQQMILRNLFLKGVDSAFKGKVIIAEDGLHLTLPTDGK